MSQTAMLIQIRWSDLDPNFHLRHSVYYDLAASMRTSILTSNGVTPAAMQEKKVGPILFREECVFKREIHFGDPVEIDAKLLKCTRDGSRWTIQHHVFKNPETVSAIITVDGAWLNTELRKLTAPPPEFGKVFELFPKTEDFTWIEK